jgi:hypothetical protein
VAPRGQFEIESAEEVDQLLTDDMLAEFFDVPAASSTEPAPEAVAAAEAPAEPEASGATASAGHPPPNPGPPQEQGSARGTGRLSEQGPERSEAIVGVPVHEAPGVAVAHRAPALAALNPAAARPLPTTESAISKDTGPGWLIYTGIALAAVAAAGLSYGGYLGHRSNEVRSGIKRDGTVVQTEAVAKAERASKLAREANLWMGVGGGVMALSITFVGLDILVD